MSRCDQSMEYTTRTAYKAYSCGVKGALGSMVKSITGICNVRGQKLPFPDAPLEMKPGAMLEDVTPGAAFCKLRVLLHQEPHNPLHCTGMECTFAEGKAGFSCAKSECACKKGSCQPIVQGIIDNVKNGSVGIDCKASGDCTLVGMQPRLELSCSAGECTQPDLKDAPLPTLQGGVAKPFPVVAMLACLVPIVLTLLGSLGLFYVASSSRLFRSGGSGAANAAAAAAAAAAATASDTSADPAASKKLIIKQSMTEQQSTSRGGGGGARMRLLPAELTGQPVKFEFDGIYCAVPDRGGDPSGQSGAGGPGDYGERPTTPRVEPVEGKKQKVLLYGVTGGISQGEVVGVMGPSGAGKSTLLSILSGATESVGAGARIEGTVTLGGEGRRSILRKMTSFVPQKDVLLPALTVEECVRYSALLRLPRDLSADEIQERISGVLAELGLSHVATSLVGGSASIRGVSGGERRRVTIAMALVTRPRLVIMDEPTSGLDSYTAYNLMKTAQDIASHGRVVIMSLHQPSPDMFDSLSQVLLLAKGRLAYLGTPANVGPHFSAAGFAIPQGRQPAEHMLHVASQAAGLTALLRKAPAGSNCAGPRPGSSKEGFSLKGVLGSPRSKAAAHHTKTNSLGASADHSVDEEWRIASTVDAAAQHAGAAAVNAAAAARLEPLHIPPHNPVTVLPTPTADPRPSRAAAVAEWTAGKARECAVLFWRAFTNMRREPRLLLLHMLVAIILGLVVGAVFFKLDGSNVGLQNRLGSMFFALALFGWTSVSVVDGLVLERELVEREVVGHYYTGGTYLLSSLVLDGLLLRTLPALVFCGIMYPMVGLLSEATRVVTFMFVLATYTCTVGALTTALTALCRTSSATTLAMNIVLLM